MRSYRNPRVISGAILANPQIIGTEIAKGVILASEVDQLVLKEPRARNWFIIIERRGWDGYNKGKSCDIKLVEDPSTYTKTCEIFPNIICLDLAGGDFVDTSIFKPNRKTVKVYDFINISAWRPFKRHLLFLQALHILKQSGVSYRALMFGHFVEHSEQEIQLMRNIIGFSRKANLPIDFPFVEVSSNSNLPFDKVSIAQYINLSKIGVLTSKNEGVNRFKMECLSCGIPFVVTGQHCASLQKHINSSTGMLSGDDPTDLANAMIKCLQSRQEFHPRKYVMAHTGIRRSNQQLNQAIAKVHSKSGSPLPSPTVWWDGRNENIDWHNFVEKIAALIDKVEDHLDLDRKTSGNGI